MASSSQKLDENEIDWESLGHTGRVFRPEDPFTYISVHVSPSPYGGGKPQDMTQAEMFHFLDTGHVEPRLLCLDKRSGKVVILQLCCNVPRPDDSKWIDPFSLMDRIPQHPNILKPIEGIRKFPRSWYDTIVFEAPSMGEFQNLSASLTWPIELYDTAGKAHGILPASFVYRIFRDAFTAIWDGMESGLTVGNDGSLDHVLLYDVNERNNVDNSNPILPRFVMGVTGIVRKEDGDMQDDKSKFDKFMLIERVTNLSLSMLSLTEDRFKYYCVQAKDEIAPTYRDTTSTRFARIPVEKQRSFAHEIGFEWPPWGNTLWGLWRKLAYYPLDKDNVDRDTAMEAVMKMKNLLPALKHWEDAELKRQPLTADHWLIQNLDRAKTTRGRFTEHMVEEEKHFKQWCDWVKCDDVVTRWFERCYREVVCAGEKGQTNSAKYFREAWESWPEFETREDDEEDTVWTAMAKRKLEHDRLARESAQSNTDR